MIKIYYYSHISWSILLKVLNFVPLKRTKNPTMHYLLKNILGLIFHATYNTDLNIFHTK